MIESFSQRLGRRRRRRGRRRRGRGGRRRRGRRGRRRRGRGRGKELKAVCTERIVKFNYFTLLCFVLVYYLY